MFSKLLFCINPQGKVGERLYVRAAEKIEQGELLLVDEPVVACHVVQGAYKPYPIHPDALYCDGRPYDEALYLELLRKNKIEAYARTCALEDIAWDPLRIVKNGMIESVLSGMEVTYGAALYSKVVYFDHACNGNASVSIGKHQRAYVVAKRDIEKDEEVCLNYTEFLDEDCAANYSDNLLGFKCTCEVCMTKTEKEKRSTLQIPQMLLEKTQDIPSQLVQRSFLTLMDCIKSEPHNYLRQYKMARLMMQQKEAWKKFCATSKGYILVFLGLKASVAALMHFKTSLAKLSIAQLRRHRDFEELYLFMHTWSDILTTTSFGDRPPPSYEYGKLLHTLLCKYFRIIKGRSQNDFMMVYIKLVKYMQDKLYAAHPEETFFHMFTLHLEALGWVRVLEFVQEWGKQSLMSVK